MKSFENASEAATKLET